jgi:hypothetical protein
MTGQIDRLREQPPSEKNAEALGNLLKLVDHVATQLFFSLEVIPVDSYVVAPIKGTSDRQHYLDVKPTPGAAYSTHLTEGRASPIAADGPLPYANLERSFAA